jgi:hypothetical protein
MIYSTVFEQFPVCNIGFYPPASVQSVVNPCLAYTRDSCKTTGIINNRSDDFLTKACQRYHIPFYNTHNEVYKNIYCALCHIEAKDLKIQSDKDDTFSTWITPFSALMDFKKIEKESIAKKTKCANYQIFDEKMVRSFILPLSISFQQS